MTSPKRDGFFMPAEFDTHEECWLIWPDKSYTWRNGGVNAQKVFCDVANIISKSENVSICVSKESYASARLMLNKNIRLVEMSSNDSWMRDTGPCFLVNEKRNELRGVNFRFNAYGGENGGLYRTWHHDELITSKILELQRAKKYDCNLILEGGAVSVDGNGTMITTKECLLNKNRNPNLSQVEVENILKEYFNLRKVIWLEKGVYMDETDGHTDNFCRFVASKEVVLHYCSDKNDPQYQISQDALKILENESDADGNKLKIHLLEQPSPMHITKEESEGVLTSNFDKPRLEGERMAASYVNFYIGKQNSSNAFF